MRFYKKAPNEDMCQPLTRLVKNENDDVCADIKHITLVDGSVLECYVNASFQVTRPIDNSLQLDSTGYYLQVGKKKCRRIPLPEGMPEVRSFLEYAHFLFERRDDILKDSRMFLTPIPFNNGLAYTGESGFQHPILGVYIEWWMSNEESRPIDGEGNKWLIWHLSGSPLSHQNNCGLVTKDGKVIRKAIQPFMKLVSNFMTINRRYDDVKGVCEAYKLEEVLFKLKQL